MQATKKSNERRKNDEKEKKDSRKKPQEPKSLYTISTSRDFVQKSSTADIYVQKKKSTTEAVKPPKKVVGSSNISNTSPMKGLLRSSASSVSHISKTDRALVRKADIKPSSARKTETRKPLLSNVTVNSPTVKRKLDFNSERISKEVVSSRREKSKEVEILKEVIKVRDGGRPRTKTRTLDESEVKVLTSDVVDNNMEMINLSQKLVGKPKAFYVDLDVGVKITSLTSKENKEMTQENSTKVNDNDEEEISYEDDFESYESDFDSYHSEHSKPDELSEKSDESERSENDKRRERHEQNAESVEGSSKEVRDEEKMLDSGNFDLRDQRSAKAKGAVMENILEGCEEDKRISLTDEGFQDMSSSSAVSSIKITEVLDRPVFIDFTKSKRNKLKRKISERLKQRAKDLLSMITLHEMSYSLFEMQPISYDLYMATFGRSNYTQSGVQTFDDGITEEIQTDEICVSQKWTQYPVEFSNRDVCVQKDMMARKYSKRTEDYLSILTLFTKQNENNQSITINMDENYKSNPLRVYFEQKDGVGSDEMLPYEIYKSKLKNNGYNAKRLIKFLRKSENRLSRVLSFNAGQKDAGNLTKAKFPFSKGFVSISSKSIREEKLTFLNCSKIARIFISQSKSNLILTVHENTQNCNARKCSICLWDISVASVEPMKVLTAIDNVLIGKFHGSTDGIFVAALEDGSLHLWDLSEEPTWRTSVVSDNKSTEFLEINSTGLPEIEKDREWNLKNRQIGFQQPITEMALQSSAYTNSAFNMSCSEPTDTIVGLEMTRDTGNIDGDRRTVGQIISLQRSGALTIWSLIQEKQRASSDIGKAYCSKIKLEKSQTMNLYEQIASKTNINNDNFTTNFNLNAAKRRLSMRNQEKGLLIKEISRPKSAITSKFDFDIDRPSSAASMRKRVLPVEIDLPKNWESGIVCNDLKIMMFNGLDCYLVARNCGEVLLCKRCFGALRIERFCVATDTSSVTSIEVSTKGLPYFMAATDTGTVNLCSLLDTRVLLTLDCRNVSLSMEVVDKCNSDHKGRYISSIRRTSVSSDSKSLNKLEIKSVHWSSTNPCRIYVLQRDATLLLFELTHSDICAKYVAERAALDCAVQDNDMALLTPEGEVEVHRLNNQETKDDWCIFEKYVSLL